MVRLANHDKLGDAGPWFSPLDFAIIYHQMGDEANDNAVWAMLGTFPNTTEITLCDTPPMTDNSAKARYEIVDFGQLDPVHCPCGSARRAFGSAEDFPGTVHVTEIDRNARLHYHKQLIEVYYFLECESDAQMQLGEDLLAVHPGLCVLVRPGTRHRAIGHMKVLILVTPKFDPLDEWFD